jgi:hypothetical protein
MISEFAPQGKMDDLIAQTYEQDRGYKRLYESALAVSPYVGMPPTTLVPDRGFDVLPCLGADAVAGFCDQVFDEAGCGRFTDLTDAEMTALLAQIRTPAVHKAIATALGCHYAFVFAEAAAATPVAGGPTAGAMISFRWHADNGPRAHLKIILYLDGPDSHDGATSFLDRQTTEAIAAAGYLFPKNEDRLADLGPLAAAHGITLVEHRLSPQAGEAVLFHPAQVLHRGLLPSFGRRRTFWGSFPTPCPSPRRCRPAWG